MGTSLILENIIFAKEFCSEVCLLNVAQMLFNVTKPADVMLAILVNGLNINIIPFCGWMKFYKD